MGPHVVWLQPALHQELIQQQVACRARCRYADLRAFQILHALVFRCELLGHADHDARRVAMQNDGANIHAFGVHADRMLVDPHDHVHVATDQGLQPLGAGAEVGHLEIEAFGREEAFAARHVVGEQRDLGRRSADAHRRLEFRHRLRVHDSDAHDECGDECGNEYNAIEPMSSHGYHLVRDSCRDGRIRREYKGCVQPTLVAVSSSRKLARRQRDDYRDVMMPWNAPIAFPPNN